MSVVILKYGGSSLVSAENLREVARQVIRCKASGQDPVVVVSAMGDTTDHFLQMAYEITDRPGARELDMLLSVGERISIALLALAIDAEGPYQAISLTGSQVGIITDTNHTQAKILEVRCDRIRQVLEKGQIPIVAGYQGVSIEKEITTLGRGGSDTTAVALAAALGAEECRIMKDVEGVYTADPRQVAGAHVIDRLHYDQMVEFAVTGSPVLAADSVALARQHGVKIAVGLATSGSVGTIVTSGDFGGSGVRGLVALRRLMVLRLGRHLDLPQALADLHSSRLSISSLHSEAARPVLLLNVADEVLDKSVFRLLQSTEWGTRCHPYKRPYARISAIGSGLEPGGKHFARLLSLLEENKNRPRWFCCSPTRVSFCVPDGEAPALLNRMHGQLIQHDAAS